VQEEVPIYGTGRVGLYKPGKILLEVPD